jgi:hypothetical protein
MLNKAANLCQYDMPNGKLCRQVAVKGEQLCRQQNHIASRQTAEFLFPAGLAGLVLPELFHSLIREFIINNFHQAFVPPSTVRFVPVM